MRDTPGLSPILFPVALLAIAVIGFGQAAVGGRGGGGMRGPGSGTPGIGAPAIDLYGASSSRGGVFNDLELTALTRLDEQVEGLRIAAEDARKALLVASLAPNADEATLSARTDDLGNAELALAIARSAVFARFQADNHLSPEKVRALAQQIGSGTLGGRGTGGIGIGGARPPTPPGPPGTR